MDWTDAALILRARPHGEGSLLAILLTETRGRHAGLVRGGRNRTFRGSLEPGTLVQARWRARLAEHLGAFQLESVRSYGGALYDQPERLAALVSACTLVDVGLHDQDPHPDLYRGLLALFESLEQTAWAEAYVAWEVGLLAELGFGLTLNRCALTGATEGLTHVSPRSGRAVTRGAAEPWLDRLLPLPGFLVGAHGQRGAGGPAAVRQGLALTGHFLARHLPGGLPAARQRLAELYGRGITGSVRECPLARTDQGTAAPTSPTDAVTPNAPDAHFPPDK